ncbi:MULTISPECIES: hypothetical protein [unclassified Halomonas]|uniref:hypothetical protein n=1 Tax=unclassified Halomonas TaxID=2609666 RepID=UPI002886725B|nr:MULTISPECIES: hypothetical protein [unclassified Halomonas]MDT0501329.1 hypothetical protein [Halomonas sp. PAR7]MDT0512147.1 hypothetical protein [Halomonas sp. LES1]MDT0590716.1 hypothetical protein [Halomonas sp. PAR8]
MTIEKIEACSAIMLEKGWATDQSTISPSMLKDLSEEEATTLAGKKMTLPLDWRKFKSSFVESQAELGFEWNAGQGHGGPLELNEVRFPEAVGVELATGLMKRKITTGTLAKAVSDILPKTQEFVEKSGAQLELGDLRKGFKDHDASGYSYRFSPGRGSRRFTLSLDIYKYQGGSRSSRKREEEFGEAIEEHVKSLFDLDEKDHAQRKRKGRRYENADIVGFRISRRMEGDKFIMYSFEVKPANDIGSISQAISQAVNYRSRANYTYIVIPQMDYSSFHDNDRLADLLSMCRDNAIGALSVNMDTDTHEVLDVVEVQSAIDTGLDDTEWLSSLVDASDFEHCPLCRKVVNKNTRTYCGWSFYKDIQSKGSKDDGEKVCMKLAMESQVRNS